VQGDRRLPQPTLTAPRTRRIANSAAQGDKDCPGGHCIKGACSAKKACKSEDDCAQDEDCLNGWCSKEKAPAPPSECRLIPCTSTSTSGAHDRGDGHAGRDADCLKKVGRSTLTGHTDPRGTQEYNLALSERRAQSVRDHLGRLGADGTKMTILPRGSLDAKGTDEPSWSQDRRVDFTWR
jgi:peptidoglycan-associated lipoprotein